MEYARFGDSLRVPQKRDPLAGSIAVGADPVVAWQRTQVIAGMWQGPLTAHALADRFGLSLQTVGGILAQFELIGMVVRHPGGRWALNPEVVPAAAVDIHQGVATFAQVDMATRMNVSDVDTVPLSEALDTVTDFAVQRGLVTIGVSANSQNCADWRFAENLTLDLLERLLGAVLVDEAVAVLAGQELILPSPFVGSLSLSHRDGEFAAALARPGTFGKARLPAGHWVTTPEVGPQCETCGLSGCVSAWVAHGDNKQQAEALVSTFGGMVSNLSRTLFTGFDVDVVDAYRELLYARGVSEGWHAVSSGYASYPYLQGAAILAGTHNLVSLDIDLHMIGVASPTEPLLD